MKRFLLLYLFIPSAAMATVVPCAIQTAQDVLSCALKRHPDILRADAALQAASAREQAARQIPNPEISGESASFDDQDQPELKFEAAYLHTFELGGKRPGRLREAKARRDMAAAQLQQAQERVALGVVRDLFRLRQIRTELRVVDEARETFGKIVKSYESRLRRSAEQEVSLGVFRLASSDYELRKSALLQERDALKASLEVATGEPFDTVVAALPVEKTEWPKLHALRTVQAGARQEAAAAVTLSEAELGLARSQAWPDVKLGPRLEAESGRGQNAQGYGAALSMGLPLYHQNQGAKRAAQADVSRTQVELAQTERELTVRYDRWRAAYEEAVRAYRASPALEDIEKRHEEMEYLFARGLVPATLVIEAHRQLADFARSRHEQELRALEALWSIYTLEGRVLEERI